MAGTQQSTHAARRPTLREDDGDTDMPNTTADTLASILRDGLAEMRATVEKATDLSQANARAISQLQEIVRGHQADLSDLKARPAGMRSDITGYGGCLAMAAATVVSSAIGAIGLVVSIIALVTRH